MDSQKWVAADWEAFAVDIAAVDNFVMDTPAASIPVDTAVHWIVRQTAIHKDSPALYSPFKPELEIIVIELISVTSSIHETVQFSNIYTT